ncbi:MAG: ATPase [Muribaculaceae bacterium]|nr:ATPase [Muribaculaceae bacterium]
MLMSLFSTLIADAGSTKVEWAAVGESSSDDMRFTTPGINAILASEKEIASILTEVKRQVNDRIINEIYYYGAGCATPLICGKIEKSLKEVWPEAKIMVCSDLVGASKSLLGNNAGIACILGTGSNSASYDGEKIVSNIPPLGFILGDEGSGTALGKRLIKEIFKGNIPVEIKEDFFSDTELTLPEIINRVYREPLPNKFIASLIPFIRKHIRHPFINNMVVEEFREFFKRNVALYPDARKMDVNFTGSVAFHFEKELRKASISEGFRIGKISQAPMDGLIRFHLFESSKE